MRKLIASNSANNVAGTLCCSGCTVTADRLGFVYGPESEQGRSSRDRMAFARGWIPAFAGMTYLNFAASFSASRARIIASRPTAVKVVPHSM